MSFENVKIVREQGGDRLVVKAGGAINIEAGGQILAAGSQAVAIAPLTAASGTADDTVADVGGSFSQTTLNNNFKDLATKINAIQAALEGAGIIAPSA